MIGEVSTGETSITSAPAKMELAREGGTPSQPTPAGSQATPASTTTSGPKAQEEVKKENKPQQQPSVMGQLAQEAAAKAKQVAKKVPASPTKEKESEEAKDTPLSPSGVPLPNSPAVKSPVTIDSALKSPTAKSPSPSNSETVIKSPTSATSPRISHHRHSSTGSAHSFIPEKSEPEVREHRGSELSAASQDEIKRIESECSIAEEDEEELDEEAEDAILFGDADEDENTKAGKKDEEDTAAKPVARRTSVSKPPALTPVAEEPKTLDTKSGPAEPQKVTKSAGVPPKEPDDAVGDEDDDEEDDEDEDEDSEDEEDDEGAKDKVPSATSSAAKDALPSSKTAPAGTTSSSSSTTPADTKLANAVDKIKIEDQKPAEAKQASVSVED